jgi:8-oxo-dGTP diphosphatase
MNQEIRFFIPGDEETNLFDYAIIAAHYQESWIWVRHRDRDTWELPAGHIETGESPIEAAHRELFEETGAIEYKLKQIVAYEGFFKDKPVKGMLFLAEIVNLGPLPDFEIREISFHETIPERLTYPGIQPQFMAYIERMVSDKNQFLIS